jgi:hypothetical protein
VQLTKPLLALALAGIAGLAACGSDTNVSSATTAAAASATTSEDQAMAEQHMSAFCANAEKLGSLSKGTADAMAMAPAESAKDFQALADKVTALRADATPEVQADIDTVVARLGLEVMVESHKADGTSPDEQMAKLNAQKATDDAAVGRLVAAVKTDCGVDIT